MKEVNQAHQMLGGHHNDHSPEGKNDDYIADVLATANATLHNRKALNAQLAARVEALEREAKRPWAQKVREGVVQSAGMLSTM